MERKNMKKFKILCFFAWSRESFPIIRSTLGGYDVHTMKRAAIEQKGFTAHDHISL